MSRVPEVRSFEQILGDGISTYQSKRDGVNDLIPGGPLLSFLETTAQMVYRATGDVFQILKDNNVDRAEGQALRRIAREERVPILSARVATGIITVKDSSFEKIATRIYTGSNSPNIGSTTVRLSDASSFPSTGAVYLGRGTPNIEGPISYSDVQQVGSFWELTLDNPTTRFHNRGESVILAQGGNRLVEAGTVVLAPSSGIAPDILFSTTENVTLLDGENEITRVPVVSQNTGSRNNVPAGSITEFSGSPFPGASVLNPVRFSTGRDDESDESLRARIKTDRLSRGLGTPLAIRNSTRGATAQDENATIVSNQIVSGGERTTLFIDNGEGYEAKSTGVGLEFIVDSALGGERTFNLATGGRQTSVAKAFIESSLSAPFDVNPGDSLAVLVGDTASEHVFSQGDFVSNGAATAFEIVASINANFNLFFQASTSDGGRRVALEAKAEENEYIQVSIPAIGFNANQALGFPINEIETLRLYINDIPLSKNGREAVLRTEPQSVWSSTITSGDTLIISVDGTSEITYTFINLDFINEGTHSIVSNTNSLLSWVNVINSKVTGITADIDGEQIRLRSNLGALSRASLSISPSSTLVSKGMFTSSQGLQSSGRESDYTLSRNTAQLNLNRPLSPGDRLTAGSDNTNANVKARGILGGVVTLPDPANVWFIIDDPISEIINTALSADVLLHIAKMGNNTIRIESEIAGVFSTVQEGDYVIIWSEEFTVNNRGEFRVSVANPDYLEFRVTGIEYALISEQSPIEYREGLIVLRSEKTPVKVTVAAGTREINSIAAEIQSQVPGITVRVESDEDIIVSSNTRETSGFMHVVTFDDAGRALNFTQNEKSQSIVSQTSFYQSGIEDGDFPLFIHGSFNAERIVYPPEDFVNDLVLDDDHSDQGLNFMVGVLNPYSSQEDVIAKGEVTLINDLSTNTVDIEENLYLKRIRNIDRYYLADTFDFAHQDDVVVVLDENVTDKVFTLPLYRAMQTNTTFPADSASFNAYDTAAGPTANPEDSFGEDFDFSNYKVMMRAKGILNPPGPENSILYKSAIWGAGGEHYTIAYAYPTQPESDITHTVDIGSIVNIKIFLKSDEEVPTTHDGTTRWNITITPDTPVAGVDQVTYTYAGVGTAPGLSVLDGGEYISIRENSGFSPENTGTFRISTESGFEPTATSFTVVRKSGEALQESDIDTLVGGSMVFYMPEATTAQEIVDYVEENMGDYILAELLDDSGTDGSGIVIKSTEEEENFSIGYVKFVDGLNWIKSSDLGGDPQFTLKKPLELYDSDGFSINDGVEMRLVPTTTRQISEFLNILAVTGYTTLGEVTVTDRAGRVELSTDILGSEGSVNIIGGPGNSTSSPVEGASLLIENDIMVCNTQRATTRGITGGQWVKLSALDRQNKITDFSSNNRIRIRNNTPTAGKTTIDLSFRELGERHFGSFKAFTRDRNRTFRVEKQGRFVCISHDGNYTGPRFSYNIDMNTLGGGTLSVAINTATGRVTYAIESGDANFRPLSFGDRVTFSNFSEDKNNGTFEVMGSSDDGKTLVVRNFEAVQSLPTGTITIVDNANITADSFTIGDTTLTEGVDFNAGIDEDETAALLAAEIALIVGVNATSTDNIITVTSTSQLSGQVLEYTDSGSGVSATLSGATLDGEPFSDGDIEAVSFVREGDNVILGEPFNILNQGTYRIIRTFGNSIYIDNPNHVEEMVTIPNNSVSFQGDDTTSYAVKEFNGNMRVEWDGSGTEPDFGQVKSGDKVILGVDFDPQNRGEFSVYKSRPRTAQITFISCAAGNQMITGSHFIMYSANDSVGYYFYYDIDGGGGDPMVVGFTGVAIPVNSVDSPVVIAEKTRNIINALADFSASFTNNTVTAQTTGFGYTTESLNVDIAGGFNVSTLQQGHPTFLEIRKAAFLEESGIAGTDSLDLHRPSMKFREYEASVAGDILSIGSPAFGGSANIGSYAIEEVVDQSRIILGQNINSLQETPLLLAATSLLVQEGVRYEGYKKIKTMAVDPGNTTRMRLVFDTEEQFNKINRMGRVQIQSVSKMEFPSGIKKGLDSYRFHTGLIGEASRIVYGDPRDRVTYPGVSAAGAEIFIREPLVKRITISISIRVRTGVPFTRVAEQVRNAVSALINSNDVGEPIAISTIVASVDSIPGVRAVAIDSPQYDSANDVISVQPNEKTIVIDSVSDVIVAQIG
jgi:hypothetical protein